jgi:hypothetical protein
MPMRGFRFFSFSSRPSVAAARRRHRATTGLAISARCSQTGSFVVGTFSFDADGVTNTTNTLEVRNGVFDITF